MENQAKTPKSIRQRKFMLVLPALVLPFMTMMFWALGGGKITKADAQEAHQTGFNINLPDANVKEGKAMDKMSYYDKAKLDSLKFLELVKNDPNYKDSAIQDTLKKTGQTSSLNTGLNSSVYGNGVSNDPNADKIYRKLADLDREMKKPVGSGTAYATSRNLDNAPAKNTSSVSSADVNRLEQMMQAMSQSDGEDPEMQQLNGMLEKILDVQHPERVQEKLKQNSELRRGQLLAVSGKTADNGISTLDRSRSGSSSNRFYSLEADTVSNIEANAIQAVIHETQTLVDGSVVKLRLVNDVMINGVGIPKDNFIFGMAQLNGERLSIKINSIRFNNSLFPVELAVYDMDGLDGLYIPGAITRDVAKQSADRSMQNIGLTSLDPSFGAQAMGAGIDAAKTVFSKKVKLIKVTVKAGYQVLLRDGKQK